MTYDNESRFTRFAPIGRQAEHGLAARFSSCPTCGSAISCAATRWCSSAARRAFPTARSIADHHALRAACRLHARRAQGHCRATCRASAWPLAQHRALAASACSVRAMARRWSCRGPGNRRWRRFSPAFPSAPALSAKPASACSTTCASANASCRAWSTAARALALPRGASCPADWPAPRARRAGSRGRRLARQARPGRRWPAGRRARPGRGRTVEALAGRLLRRPHAPACGRRCCRLGAGRPRREAARGGDRRRHAGARSHRPRPARRHPGAGVGVGRRSPTIPACCMSPPRSARRRSAYSARPVRGTGRRSIRSRQRSRRRASCPAGHATSRYAASAITAACATSPRRKF